MTEGPTRIFSFDTGIEQILQGGEQVSESLPETRASLLPSSDHMSRRLEELFEAPSLDRLILSQLEPELHDKNILIPRRYHAMLAGVHERLQKLAEERKGKKGGRALADAAALLDEEKELMGLLSTYRNTLHQA